MKSSTPPTLVGGEADRNHRDAMQSPSPPTKDRTGSVVFTTRSSSTSTSTPSYSLPARGRWGRAPYRSRNYDDYQHTAICERPRQLDRGILTCVVLHPRAFQSLNHE